MARVLQSAKTKLNNKIELLGNDIYKNILVIGVFHGDEPQGKFLIDEYLKINPNSQLLFIPCLNPDGMAVDTRTNSNGVDLNRNFPTKNWELTERNEFFGGTEPASEIETKFLIDIINEYKPVAVLTLHAPFKVVNYDGPAKDIAEKIGQIISYPIEECIGYPTPGSFGTYSGVERNIPTITLELDEKCPVQDLIIPVHKIFDYLCNNL